MDVLLANPRGFCAGVDRAIEIVKRAIDLLGAPIYVRHEVVHNRFVVDDLRQRGAIFVEELDEVPDGATVIFSAHGVSQAVRREADRRGLKVFDATCPLVTKVHMEVARHCRAGRDMVLIGHAGHPEVEGTMGQWAAKAAYTTQTTLSVDDTRDIIDGEHIAGSSASSVSRQMQGPKPRRHLLRHAESPGCGARAGRRNAGLRPGTAQTGGKDPSRVLVVGIAEFSLQFQPVCANWPSAMGRTGGLRGLLIDGAEDIDPA
jgi:4-hydroxy-3-methylbut-2-enyl diphosphate reductase